MQTGAVKSYYEKSGKSHDEALIAAIAVMDTVAADIDMSSAYPRQIEFLHLFLRNH